MISQSEIDEMLKRIVTGGQRPDARSDEGLGLEEIRALAANSSEPGEDMPKGTKVTFAEDEPRASVPVRQPLRPKAPELTQVEQPRTVQVPTQSQDQMDAAYARAEDRRARQAMAFERGTRELIGGLTRTQAQPVIQRPTDAFSQWAQEQQRKQQARQQAESNDLRRQEIAARAPDHEAGRVKADAYARSVETQAEEGGRRDERARAQREASAAEFEERKRHNQATEGIGWTNAKKTGAGGVKERMLTMRENAIKPRSGWEPIVAEDPVFRSPQDASKFDSAVAAMGAIRNHRDHVLHEVDALKQAKTPGEADIIVGRLNAQMGALASKLRDAEGLNNTDASNQAVENMLSLSHGSAVNWKNLLNQGRLPGILNAAVSSGEANLDTMASSQNLRRSKGSGAAQHEEGKQRRTATNPKTGEKLEWDGKEWVPPQ